MLRSLLFVPVIRPRFIEKAPASGADAVIVDMEDSVAPAEKVGARPLVGDAVRQIAATGMPVYVRVNGLDTGLLEEDVYASVGPQLAGLSIPKANDAETVRQVDSYLTLLERVRGLTAGSLKLLLWIETAKGIINVPEVVAASLRVQGACFGAEDLTADLGIPRSESLQEIEVARARVVYASHAAGVLPLDTPSAEFRDLDRVRTEAAASRNLGYKGKFCIHPDQVAICNEVFGVSEADAAWARRVIEVYEEGERNGLGAVALDGAMVDRPVYLRALRLLGR